MNVVLDLSHYEKNARWRVNDFKYKHSEKVLHLAYHAALPVILNADLLHLLRINFFLDSPEALPYTADAELLLSPLCNRIDSDLYMIDREVRSILLRGFAREYDKERIRDVATLLWLYSEDSSSWLGQDELRRAQQLTALNFLDPSQARQWLETYENQRGLMESLWFVSMRKEIEWADNIFLWNLVEEHYKSGELLKARVIDYNMGGLIVDAAGLRGFVPISQLLNFKREGPASDENNQETVEKLQSMKDRELLLKVIEADRVRNRLILSERLSLQEQRQRRREELLDELKPGEVRQGVVSNLVDFGAFVDLGGADGLVHISQLAWNRVNHPSEVVRIGQEVDVRVLGVDKEKKKISLSIKDAEADPWIKMEQHYRPGQVVKGIITKIAPFGVFARIEPGVEGLIHLSELPPEMDPRQTLHEGVLLQLRILHIDAGRHRLGLSLRQVQKPGTPQMKTTGSTHGTSRRREEHEQSKPISHDSLLNDIGSILSRGYGHETAMGVAFSQAISRYEEETQHTSLRSNSRSR